MHLGGTAHAQLIGLPGIKVGRGGHAACEWRAARASCVPSPREAFAKIGGTIDSKGVSVCGRSEDLSMASVRPPERWPRRFCCEEVR
jgi:hypothetical protein